MKIRSTGIEITDICEQIPAILVSASGAAHINMRTAAGGLVASSEMEPADLIALRGAIDAAIANVRPPKVRDASGDVWTWLDSHNGYVLDEFVPEHADCTDDGRSIEYIKEGWGPVTVIE